MLCDWCAIVPHTQRSKKICMHAAIVADGSAALWPLRY
jgi:hypothetical protein